MTSLTIIHKIFFFSSSTLQRIGPDRWP